MSKGELLIEDFVPETKFTFYKLENPFAGEANILPVGLDIGYSGVKMVSYNGRHIFPSFLLKMNKDVTKVNKETNIKYKDENGHIWFVGELAQENLKTERDIITEENLYGRSRVDSREFLVLARVSIFLSILNSKKVLPKKYNLKIKTGLPEGYIESDRKRLVEKFVGKHKYSVMLGDSGWKNVEFEITKDDISVISQPFGTLWAIATNKAGDVIDNDVLDSKNVLIFDGGFHTIDTYFNRVGSQGISISLNNLGMYEVFRRTCEDIYRNTDGDRSLKVYELFNYIKNKNGIIKYSNEIYDIKPDFKRNLEAVANEVVEELKLTYNNFYDVDVFVCSGGLGKAFYPFLKSKLGGYVDVILAEDLNNKKEADNYTSVFSNASGFFNCLVAELKDELGGSNYFEIAGIDE